MTKKILHKFQTFFIFLVYLVFTSVATFISPVIVSASEKQIDGLISSLSKDYTKKFCNGIAFGLSQDSAMNFAINENKQVYKKKKGIEKIDNEVLATKISNSIINKCGYRLNLIGDEGIEEFKQYFLSIKK